MSQLRVLIGDYYSLFSDCFSALLSGTTDLVVVERVTDGHKLLQQSLLLRPNLVISDINLPGMPVLDAFEQIKKHCQFTKVALLTGRHDEEALYEAISAGVDGYILKTESSESVMRGMRLIAQGQKYLSEQMVTLLVEMQRPAEGDSVKAIASKLNLSIKTIEAHKFNLMRKLGIHNHTQLIQYAYEKRIISTAGAA